MYGLLFKYYYEWDFFLLNSIIFIRTINKEEKIIVKWKKQVRNSEIEKFKILDP